MLPVKGGSGSKSRLAATYGSSAAALADAIARDTVDRVLGAVSTNSVSVVTGDEVVARWVGALGVRVLEDPGAGLNAAVSAGLAASDGSPTAVLLADLPALVPEELLLCLTAARHHRVAYLADHDGTGTTLLTVRSGEHVVPQFGRGSSLAHARAGAIAIQLDVPSVRLDVDDASALHRAVAMGAGPRLRELAVTLDTALR